MTKEVERDPRDQRDVTAGEILETCEREVRKKEDAEWNKVQERVDYNERVQYSRTRKETKGYNEKYSEGYDRIDWSKK
jgi:hypothetical protein